MRLLLILIFVLQIYSTPQYIRVVGVIDSLGTESTLYLQQNQIGDTIILQYEVDMDKKSKPTTPLFQTTVSGRLLHIYKATLMGGNKIPHAQGGSEDTYSRYGSHISDSISMLWFYEKTNETEWMLKVLSKLDSFNKGDSITGYEEIKNLKYNVKAKHTFKGIITRIDNNVKIINKKQSRSRSSYNKYSLIIWGMNKGTKKVTVFNPLGRRLGIATLNDLHRKYCHSTFIIKE
jgi:hypothetical protein